MCSKPSRGSAQPSDKPWSALASRGHMHECPVPNRPLSETAIFPHEGTPRKSILKERSLWSCFMGSVVHFLHWFGSYSISEFLSKVLTDFGCWTKHCQITLLSMKKPSIFCSLHSAQRCAQFLAVDVLKQPRLNLNPHPLALGLGMLRCALPILSMTF